MYKQNVKKATASTSSATGTGARDLEGRSHRRWTGRWRRLIGAAGGKKTSSWRSTRPTSRWTPRSRVAPQRQVPRSLRPPGGQQPARPVHVSERLEGAHRCRLGEASHRNQGPGSVLELEAVGTAAGGGGEMEPTTRAARCAPGPGAAPSRCRTGAQERGCSRRSSSCTQHGLGAVSGGRAAGLPVVSERHAEPGVQPGRLRGVQHSDLGQPRHGQPGSGQRRRQPHGSVLSSSIRTPGQVRNDRGVLLARGRGAQPRRRRAGLPRGATVAIRRPARSKKLVVTGFSRWGKAALVAGFLDDRFQVTAPADRAAVAPRPIDTTRSATAVPVGVPFGNVYPWAAPPARRRWAITCGTRPTTRTR